MANVTVTFKKATFCPAGVPRAVGEAASIDSALLSSMDRETFTPAIDPTPALGDSAEIARENAAATAAATAAVAGHGLADGAHGSGSIYAEKYSVACWGDSLTYGVSISTNYPLYLTADSGRRTYNGGVSGQTSTQIAARVIADTGHAGWGAVIWAGRNNYTDSATVIADIQSMIDAIGHDRYLVLSILNGADEKIGTSKYNAIIALNAALAEEHIGHWIDIRSLLISDGLEIAGVEPTAQDTICIAEGAAPLSLRADSVHLNALGYYVVGEIVSAYVVANWGMPELLSGDDALKLLQDLPQIGMSSQSDAKFNTVSPVNIKIGSAKIEGSGDGSKLQVTGGMIPVSDGTYNIGFNSVSNRWSNIYLKNSVNISGLSISTGAGSPEGVVTANVGSMFLRNDGAAGATLYVKEVGTGNTGWAAK